MIGTCGSRSSSGWCEGGPAVAALSCERRVGSGRGRLLTPLGRADGAGMSEDTRSESTERQRGAVYVVLYDFERMLETARRGSFTEESEMLQAAEELSGQRTTGREAVRLVLM